MAEDINLGDMVSAFRLEVKDGLAKMDSLWRQIDKFEAGATARFRDVGDAGEREGSRLAQGLASGLAEATQHLGNFVLATLGVGTFLETLRRLGDAFIAENAEMETYVTRLVTFTGSVGAAQQEMERLEAFAAKMGGNVGDLVDAYILLRQRGIDPSSKSLEALGNAAVATNTTMANVAQAMAMATMDAGRGLRQFGIQMTESAGRATFEWAAASGEIKRSTVAASDTAIQATLLAIWNDKYAGRMAEAATNWNGMVTRFRTIFGQFLEDIGKAGAWDELKAQFVGLMATVKALKDGGEAESWATSTSSALTGVARTVGLIASSFMELPLAAQAAGDFVGRTFANILTAMEQFGVGALEVAKKVLSVMPQHEGEMKVLDSMIASLKGSVKDTEFAAGDLDRQMRSNLDEMRRVQAAGALAAEGYRAAAAGAKGIIPDVDEAGASLRRLNAAFDEEGKTLLATYGVFNQARLDEEMAKIVKAADDLHQHGVPANEILAALGPTVKKLATAAEDFGPSFQLPDDFRRLREGVDSGKIGMEDFVRYMDDQAWAALKTGASDTVISVTTAGGGIAAALKGGFGRGIDDAITSGKTKFRQFVEEMGREKIVIGVDISEQSLREKLMALGVTLPGLDPTGGGTRPS